jgi:hypothetical protein
MAYPINLLVLILCVWWMYRSNKSNAKLLVISIAFIAAMIVSFLLAMAVQNDYLDGLGHLVAMGVGSVLFWLVSVSMILVLCKGLPAAKKLGKIAILSLVLVIPLFIWLAIAGANFKIGG